MRFLTLPLNLEPARRDGIIAEDVAMAIGARVLLGAMPWVQPPQNRSPSEATTSPLTEIRRLVSALGSSLGADPAGLQIIVNGSRMDTVISAYGTMRSWDEPCRFVIFTKRYPAIFARSSQFYGRDSVDGEHTIYLVFYQEISITKNYEDGADSPWGSWRILVGRGQQPQLCLMQQEDSRYMPDDVHKLIINQLAPGCVTNIRFA